MATIQVLLLPNELSDTKRLVRLTSRLQRKFDSVPKAAGEIGQVLVSYPRDHQSEGLGEEIACHVYGEYPDPPWSESTQDAVSDVVTECLGKFALKHLKQCKFITVRIIPLKEGDRARCWHRRDHT